MQKQYRVLGLGASYGSLLAIKLVLAGHDVRLVCLPNEVEAINAEGIRVRMPVKGREGLVEVDSRRGAGQAVRDRFARTSNPADYDLVALAMQEPQYRSPGVRELLAQHRHGARAVHVDHEHAAAAVSRAHSGVGRAGAARLLHRPDGVGRLRPGARHAVQPGPAGVPSARGEDQRPAGEPADQLQGRALSVGGAHRDAARPAADIEAVRYDGMELPVKLKVHDSVFVPAREVEHAAHRQLSLRADRRGALDPRRGAQRPCAIARSLRLGQRVVPQDGRGCPTTRCRSRSMRRPRTASRGRRRPRARSPAAHRTSSASTRSCSASRPSAACISPRSTRSWRRSTGASRRIGGRSERVALVSRRRNPIGRGLRAPSCRACAAARRGGARRARARRRSRAAARCVSHDTPCLSGSTPHTSAP